MNDAIKGTLEPLKPYGSYAFSVVVVLVLWWGMLQPIVNGYRVDYENQQRMVDQQQQAIEGIKVTAATLKGASDSMRVTAATMERTVEKQARMNQKE